MKQEITPQRNLEIFAHYIIDAYDSAHVKEKGSIQLVLHRSDEIIPCYFLSEGDKLVFGFGEIDSFDVRLTSDLYDFLDLAHNKLNPVWGVITGKLKFEGDTGVFKKLFKNESIYKTDSRIVDPPTRVERNPISNWIRPRKILILNGSPRGRNGYTYQYLNRFVRGLTGAGAEITLIELGSKKIESCLGCFHCWKNDTGRCIQNDDGNELYDIYNDSDLIVYAFSLYWDTVPGIMKNFIERAFCLEHPFMIEGLTKTRHPRRAIKSRNLFVFSVCGFPEQAHFDPIKDYFKSVSHNAHVPFIGGIYRSACMFLPNDPLYFKTYNIVLDSIENAGASLYRNGKIDSKTLKAVHTKIDPKEFRLSSNKFWQNVVSKKYFFQKSV